MLAFGLESFLSLINSKSLLVIRPFRTYQNPISQATIAKKTHKNGNSRITVCYQCSMGKICLASSSNTGISIILLYVDRPHQFIARTAEKKKITSHYSEDAGI